MTGMRVAAEARGMVGAPFRLQGRDPVSGLDCVGLAVVALGRAGHAVTPPEGYGLRMGDEMRARAWLAAAGLSEAEHVMPGDLMLVRSGLLQLHLMIAMPGAGFVHAHAGLRKVVEMPGPPLWPVIGLWRASHNQSQI
ncbi:MAG: peptidoglycan endopeptidase [Sphingobium sp.]